MLEAPPLLLAGEKRLLVPLLLPPEGPKRPARLSLPLE